MGEDDAESHGDEARQEARGEHGDGSSKRPCQGGGAMTGGGEAQASERAAAEASLQSVLGRVPVSVGWVSPGPTVAPAVPRARPCAPFRTRVCLVLRPPSSPSLPLRFIPRLYHAHAHSFICTSTVLISHDQLFIHCLPYHKSVFCTRKRKSMFVILLSDSVYASYRFQGLTCSSACMCPHSIRCRCRNRRCPSPLTYGRSMGMGSFSFGSPQV